MPTKDYKKEQAIRYYYPIDGYVEFHQCCLGLRYENNDSVDPICIPLILAPKLSELSESEFPQYQPLKWERGGCILLEIFKG
jgi:hypothetical protein